MDRQETDRFKEYTEVKRRKRNSRIASQATSQTLGKSLPLCIVHSVYIIHYLLPGGEHLSPVQVDKLREEQEKKAQADAKLEKYRKMVTVMS